MAYITEDRLGTGWSDVEILNWIDSKFLFNDKWSQPLLTSAGKFAVRRNRMNFHGRGDMGSILKKKRAFERIGIRTELCSPPWFVKSSDGDCEMVESLHWGTRFDGLKLAWEADTKKLNIHIQLAMTTPLHGCRMYNLLTDDAAAFLVKWGNVTNEDVTSTTPLEIMAMTPSITPAFDRYKKTMRWTSDNTTPQQREEAKLCIGNEMVKNFDWKTYTSMERTITSYKELRLVLASFYYAPCVAMLSSENIKLSFETQGVAEADRREGRRGSIDT